MKIIISTIMVFILFGCGGGGNQYLLSPDSLVGVSKHKSSSSIGVDKISVPGYMEESKIATEISAGEMHFMDSKWAVPTSKALTSTLIRSLQKRFHNPNVQLYPWDIEREGGKRVKVIINDFIYSNGTVRLEAVYSILHIGSSRKRSYIYDTKVASAKDAASIVKAMNRAFAKLVNQIANKIR